MKQKWSPKELEEQYTILPEDDWFNLMQKDDFGAITPLLHSHINPYGKFTLDMDLRIPLRDALAS